MTSTETRTVQDELRTIAKYSLGAGKPLSAAVIIKAADRIDALEKALERITTRFEKQRRASETWWPKPAREKNDRAIKAARAALSPPSDNSDAQAGGIGIK